MKRFLMGLLMLLSVGMTCRAQTDTVFWFAAPDLDSLHQQTPVRLCVTSGAQPATVVVEMPASSSFVSQTFTLAANAFHVLDLSSLVDSVETKPINTVVHRGIRISATANISCYYEVVGLDSEIYSLKGQNALGTDFLVPMQTQFTSVSYGSNPTTSSIELVATEDGTTVQLTAPVALRGGIAAGTTVTVSLQRGESYAVQAAANGPADHLYNTVIHSNKPIAVNSTNDNVDSQDGSGVDLVGDQIVPVSQLGTRYVALSNHSLFERVYIFALQDGTTVTLNGGTTVTLQAGGYYNHALVEDALLIDADKAVAVFQTTAIGYELGGTMIPHLNCTGSRYVSHLRPDGDSCVVTIMVGTDHVGEFLVNGGATAITAADFTPLAADPTLSYCVKSITDAVVAGEVFTIQNTGGRFHLGILDGSPGSCSYGYFSDYAKTSFLRFNMDTLYCPGDDILFGYDAAATVGELTLIGPDGGSLQGPPFTIPTATAAYNGQYVISGTDEMNCLQRLADTIDIRVSLAECNPDDWLPDNVDSADCVYLPEAQEWSIGQPQRSTNTTALVLTTPLVGDVDEDGETEIVVTAMPSEGNWWDPDYDPYGRATHINVYRADGTLKRSFAVAPGNVYYTPGLARVRWADGTHRTIIVTYAADGHFYAYSGMGTQLWRSNNTFHTQTGEDHPVPAISFADFNHDGWAEMYAGSEIYDAATGVLLCRDNAGNKGFTDRASHSDRIPYMTMAADLCGDDRLELAAGNEVYDVNLQSRTDMSQNQMTVVHHVPTAGMTMEDGSAIPYHDGNTFLVDINEDGHLDVLVMYERTTTRTIFLYVWDVQGDSIICSRKISNARKFGTPQIGDIDADGHPEICFVVGTVEGVAPGSNDKIYALKRNASARQMDIFWTTNHSDQSGSTGLTLFDFNQDGIAELVYRDEEQMRIINGSLRHHQTGVTLTEPYNMTTYPCGSATVMEYPVVADVDGDGEAEIIVSGNPPSELITSQRTGYIYIFKSGSAQWASARPVWNQYMYNVTCVNHDLTVPLYLFNNATPFTAADGTVGRPFNNFLQQGTTIDVHGQPFSAVPDVAADSMAVEYGYEALDVTVYYCNHGSIALSAPYSVTVFSEVQGGEAAAVVSVSEALPVDSCTSLQMTIPYADLNGVTNVVVAVNCAGGGIAQNGGQTAECDTTNNTVSQLIGAHYFYDTVVCEDQLPTTWHGMAVTTDSLYMDSLVAVNGMDSIVMMHFVVRPVHETVDSVIICPGLPFTYHGIDYGGPTSFDLDLVTRAGCDSLVHVTLYERDSNYRVRPLCRLDSVEWMEPDSLLAVCAPATLDMRDSTLGAVGHDWMLYTADSIDISTAEEVSWRFEDGRSRVEAYVSLIVTDPWGCQDSLGWPVVVMPKPSPEFRWERDVPAIDNPEVQFVNLSQPDGAIYLWRIEREVGGGFDTTTVEAPFYHWGEEGANMEGDYTVRLLSSWEHAVAGFASDTLFGLSGNPRLLSHLYEAFNHTCVDSMEHVVTITNDYLQFPNLVTPNGDDVNERWEVKNLLEYGNFSMNELWIYDRTGALVYHVKNIRRPEQFWDPNATRSPDGTYYYRFMCQGEYGTVKRNGLIEVVR